MKLSRLCFACVARDCMQARPTMKPKTNQNGTNSPLLNRLPPSIKRVFYCPSISSPVSSRCVSLSSRDRRSTVRRQREVSVCVVRDFCILSQLNLNAQFALLSLCPQSHSTIKSAAEKQSITAANSGLLTRMPST